MRIAVFHNFLDNIGGAEMVTLTLARELSADIYTTNVDKKKIAAMGFEGVMPMIHSIGKVPRNAPFRQQLALLKFRRLNLKDKYDFFIIAGDWAVSGAAHNKPNIWYAHSPIREIWDLYEYTRKHSVPRFLRPVFDAWVFYNRALNKKYVQEVNVIVANSRNTKERIKKFLKRDVAVIYPPIETSQFYWKASGNYWLSVNRIIGHKQIDVQLKAFKKIPEERLIIIGSYEKSRHFLRYAKECKRTAPSNVEIQSWVPRLDLINLYANCKGLIATSKDEDFGMNAVEAMAAGKPVIAPHEGGYRETVVDGITGVLVQDMDEEKIVRAMEVISNNLNKDPLFYRDRCQQQARNFDVEVFVKKIKSNIIQKRKNDKKQIADFFPHPKMFGNNGEH